MKFDSASIRNVSAALLCMTLAVCSVIAIKEVKATNQKITAGTNELQSAAKTLREYIEFQTEQLKSTRNQKSIEASLATPAIVNGTFRLINTQTLPLIHSTIDELQSSARSLNILVRNSDHEINRNLLPSATKTLDATTVTIREYGNTATEINRAVAETTAQINKTVTDLAAQGQVTLTEANNLLRSPEWKSLLAGLNETSQNLAATTKNVETVTANTAEASKRMPAIADDIQRFTRTTSRFRKLILVAQIAGAIAPFVN